MYRWLFIHDMKAIICFDGSAPSKTALKFAMKLDPVLEKLYVLYVKPTIIGSGASFESYVPATVYEKQDETAESIISQARAMVGDGVSNVEFLSADAGGEPVSFIVVKTAKEKGADFVITGTRKLGGLSKVILGSVSSDIIKMSEIPVLVCPEDKSEEEKKS